jgi:hypothetical protein
MPCVYLPGPAPAVTVANINKLYTEKSIFTKQSLSGTKFVFYKVLHDEVYTYHILYQTKLAAQEIFCLGVFSRIYL